MFKGYRLEAQTGRERSSRTVKELWEYTAGDITDKNYGSWLTDKSPNADVLTRRGDTFDQSLKRAKNVFTVAIPERWMRISPLAVNQALQEFRIYWYTPQSRGAEDFWRLLIFHNVKVKRVALRDYSRTGTPSASYYEVVMQLSDDIEYLDSSGTRV